MIVLAYSHIIMSNMKRSESKKKRAATNHAEVFDECEGKHLCHGECRSANDASAIDDDVTLMLIQTKKAKVKPDKCKIIVTMARVMAVDMNDDVLMDVPMPNLSFIGSRSKDGKQIVVVYHNPHKNMQIVFALVLKKRTASWLTETVQGALDEFKRRQDEAEKNMRGRVNKQSSVNSFGDFAAVDEGSDEEEAKNGSRNGKANGQERGRSGRDEDEAEAGYGELQIVRKRSVNP